MSTYLKTCSDETLNSSPTTVHVTTLYSTAPRPLYNGRTKHRKVNKEQQGGLRYRMVDKKSTKNWLFWYRKVNNATTRLFILVKSVLHKWGDVTIYSYKNEIK